MSSSLSSSPEEDNARLRRENAELREVVDALRAAQERHLAEIQELRSALTGGETLLFLRAPFADLVIEHLWPDYCAMAECCRAAREACGAAAKRSVADAFGSNAATALRTPWLAIPRFFAQERALLVGGHRRQYSGLLLRFFPERSAPLSVAAVVETCRSRRGETVRWSEEHNMAFLRGFFYVTGGSDALSCSLYMYNPCTRVWRECAAPPTQIDFEETGAQDAGNICAFGDYLVLVRVNHACQYSPDTDSWQMLPPLAAYPRCGQGLVEHHGALYVAGGCTLRIDGSVPENPLGRGCGRRVERFTTEGGGWQECGSMVRRRLDCKLFVIAGKLHASVHKITMATSIERFDEQSNSWSLLYVFSDLNTQCCKSLLRPLQYPPNTIIHLLSPCLPRPSHHLTNRPSSLCRQPALFLRAATRGAPRSVLRSRWRGEERAAEGRRALP